MTVRLGSLRDSLSDYCLARSISLSDGIRQIISESIGRKTPSHQATCFDDNPGPKIRLELRLTPQELQAILKRVDDEGFTSANRWVVSLIRANLQHEPEFGEMGLDVLYESNRLLAPLARNLNQLTRDLRQNNIQIPAYRFRILENLQTALSAHIKVIATVISKNVGRWRSE